MTLNGSTIRGLAFPADENRRQLSENLLQAGKGHRLPGKSFFISRFGVELCETFFQCYTEKVWGVP